MSKVEDYIKRVFPCKPPCDTWGACENCGESELMRVGAILQKKDNKKEIDKLKSALSEIRSEIKGTHSGYEYITIEYCGDIVDKVLKEYE